MADIYAKVPTPDAQIGAIYQLDPIDVAGNTYYGWVMKPQIKSTEATGTDPDGNPIYGMIDDPNATPVYDQLSQLLINDQKNQATIASLLAMVQLGGLGE